jgi:hypothetical protein
LLYTAAFRQSRLITPYKAARPPNPAWDRHACAVSGVNVVAFPRIVLLLLRRITMKLKTLVIKAVAIAGFATVSVYSIAEYSDYSAHKRTEVARVTDFDPYCYFHDPDRKAYGRSLCRE